MLKNPFYWIFPWFFIVSGFASHSLETVNTQTLNILSLIEKKQYESASKLLEKEISKSRDKKTKGYYALLLIGLPLNIQKKRARHEYSFIAARWAENILPKQRMQLWIETADGFFKVGELEKADKSYRQAFSIASKKNIQMEKAYILYKRAWIKINEKKWLLAFHFLKRALAGKENQLRENILSNMGQIWVESQYFGKDPIPLKNLEAVFQLTSQKQQQFIIEGFSNGIRRYKKKGVTSLASSLSSNPDLSMQVLNHIWSKELAIPPCQFLSWMETAKITKLNRGKALSVLNTCAKSLISKKRINRKQKKQIQKLVKLYEQIEKKRFRKVAPNSRL